MSVGRKLERLIQCSDVGVTRDAKIRDSDRCRTRPRSSVDCAKDDVRCEGSEVFIELPVPVDEVDFACDLDVARAILSVGLSRKVRSNAIYVKLDQRV